MFFIMQFPSCHLSVINCSLQCKQRYIWTKVWHDLAPYSLYLSKIKKAQAPASSTGLQAVASRRGVQCPNGDTVYVSIGMLWTRVKHRKVNGLNQV